MKAAKLGLGLAVCLVLTACKHVEEDRFLADVRINDKPVRLAYDTGSESTLLFSKTVKRLGLKEVRRPSGTPPPGKVMLGQTGFCTVKLRDDSYSLKLATLHLPWWWGFDVDGVIGWPDMVDEVIEIDAAKMTIRGLGKRVPRRTRTQHWLKFPLYTGTGVLAFEIPREDGKVGVVEVDTGNSAGVSLAPDRWDHWRLEHPRAHKGWTFSIMPGTGATLGRRFTADELSIGPLVLKNVPVRKANRTEMGIAGKDTVFEGSIGFQALKRMNLIIDRKNNLAYAQPKRALTTNEMKPEKFQDPVLAATNNLLRLNLRNQEYFEHAMDAFDSLKFEEAIVNCERLLALEPTNLLMRACDGEAKYHVAATQGTKTNLDEAVAEMNRVLDINPKISRAYMVLGNTRYLQGRWDEAVKSYRSFCELDAGEASYPRFFIWIIRAKNGERAAADEELKTFLEKDKKAVGGPWQADIGSFLVGQMSETNFLRAANVRDVKHPDGVKCEAWFYAGMKRQLAGDKATAKDYFQRCVATGKRDFDEYGFAMAEIK